jgi:hypothetical protein
MVDLSAIAGAVSALKGANDIAQAMMSLRDATEFQSKLIEFQKKIIEANTSAFAAQDERLALLAKISELEKDVASLEAEKRRLDRYQLKDFGGGSFAYELKASEANGEPIHRVCALCYQRENLSILQFSHRSEGQDWYDCHNCNKGQHFGTHVRREEPYRAASDF